MPTIAVMDGLGHIGDSLPSLRDDQPLVGTCCGPALHSVLYLSFSSSHSNSERCAAITLLDRELSNLPLSSSGVNGVRS